MIDCKTSIYILQYEIIIFYYIDQMNLKSRCRSDLSTFQDFVNKSLYNLEQVAIKLIETGKSLPAQISSCKETALIIASMYNLPTVCNKLIETNNCSPDHVNSQGETALILTCYYGFETIANKLVELTEYHLGSIDGTSNTALILACKRKLETVANKIIETGKKSKYECNHTHVNKSGKTALSYAIENGLDSVVLQLGQLN